jgi:hypothetical protein
MAEQKKVETQAASDERAQWAIAIIVALLVFAGAYYAYVNYISPTDHYLDNINVVAHGNPQQAILGLFTSRNVSAELVAANLTDNTLSCEALAFAEGVAGISASGYNVTPFGYVTQTGTCINANKTQIPCTAPSLIVQQGPCDCMRPDYTQKAVVVEGSNAWLCANAVNVRDILAWALTSQNTTD